MGKYTIFWLDGKCEVLEGNNLEDAFSKAGYGAGAVRAIDFTGKGDISKDYEWDSDSKDWVSVPKGIPEPGSQEYERMINFMRADLESDMGYSKIISAAEELMKQQGKDLFKEFETWKSNQ
jgi:hypothetical protein